MGRAGAAQHTAFRVWREGPCAVALMLLAASACRPAERDPRAALTPCRFEGVAEELRCGVEGTPFALLPSLAARARPDPLVVLAGRLGAEPLAEAVKTREPFERVRRRRDLVYVGAPVDPGAARCEPAVTASPEERLTFLPDEACVRSLADMRRQAPEARADALEALRVRLGVERWSLWAEGVSARIALAYADRHPERVRALVIDGVPAQAPLRWSLPKDMRAAREQLVSACEQDGPCGRRFPGMRGQFERLLAQSARESVAFTAAHPIEGSPVDGLLPPGALALTLLGLTELRSGAALLPALVVASAEGRWAPLVALSAELRHGFASRSEAGALLAELCAGGIGDVEAAPLWGDFLATGLGDAALGRLRTACRARDDWPPRPARHAAVAVPALLLSGGRDPFFPPLYAEALATRSPHARSVIVRSEGGRISSHACGPLLLETFLDSGDPASVAPACLVELPPSFVLSHAGAVP